MSEYLTPILERREIAQGTMAFWFDTSRTDFTFEAGQYADFTLIDPPETDAEGNTRVFSFASAPSRDKFMIATRMRDTAFKRVLKTLPLGTTVKIVGPRGNMTLHEDASRPAMFLAGGIGITPFRSMIEWVTREQLPHQLALLYSNRTLAATAFLSDLESWAMQNSKLKLVLTVTDSDDPSWKYERGKIDQALLKKYVDDLTIPVYYIAGPTAMTVAMRKILLDLGVSKDSIKLEAFSGY